MSFELAGIPCTGLALSGKGVSLISAFSHIRLLRLALRRNRRAANSSGRAITLYRLSHL